MISRTQIINPTKKFHRSIVIPPYGNFMFLYFISPGGLSKLMMTERFCDNFDFFQKTYKFEFSEKFWTGE